MPWSLAVHGGAGSLPRDLSAARREECLAGLRQALAAGSGVLAKNGGSLDAVQAAVVVLEDHPFFNAGRGAGFNRAGQHELHASIMAGDLRAGAAAGLGRVKNPVILARRVLEKTAHILLAGPGAEAFAAAEGLELVDNSWFSTEARRAEWRQLAGSSTSLLDVPPAGSEPGGTVGAVALDSAGHLAAATSTGGLINQLPGRIPDSALPGAGTYADQRTCAVSCTGVGEYFIRAAAAHEVHALMLHKGLSLEAAARAVIFETLPAAAGGLIALDTRGHHAFSFSTLSMARGCANASGTCDIALW